MEKDELIRRLWPDSFVEDGSLSNNIFVLRKALGEDPRYIETVPKRGYRFVGAVRCLPEWERGHREEKEFQASPSAVVAADPMAMPFSRVSAAVALIAVVALAAVWGTLRFSGTKPIQSLAVLPLENLSHDPEQDYFADAMTDDLITDLAKISALRVISRTSIMQYKGTKKTIAQIARELDVDAVLEGTVTRDQGRVRITAQLIRATPERHLWADEYEGSLNEVLTLQDAVAKAVAQEIQIKLTPQEHAMLTAHREVDPLAYENYSKGRYLWEISGEGNLEKSRHYFEQAIERDPGYALAWAGLADAYSWLASWGVVPRQEAAPRARAAAQKAIELDSSLVGPLITLAETKMNYEWDWAGTERLCKRAIEMSPNSGYAHHVYATYLAEVGRAQEAVNEAKKAHEVEPLSGVFGANVVWKLYLARRYDEAESEFRKQAAGRVITGDYIMASLYLQTGRTPEALEELRAGAAGPNPGALELMYLGHALGVTGARAEGQKVLQRMLDLRDRRYVPPEYIAIVYEGLGERDRAIQWFEKAYAERSINGWILPDPRLDNIQTDPRFKDILRRMGLPQ
jgi:TolB-like protein